MPSFPEVVYVPCFIRTFEVNRKVHSDHLADASSHVAITAKVKIYLE